jgi:hypothetical protein
VGRDGDSVSERKLDVAIALSLALLSALAVGITAQNVGFTRDEGYYFKAAELYWNWIKSPSLDSIDRWWSYNHEHPALLKSLFALSYGVADSLGLPVQVHNAMRFPAWLVAGGTVALVYALARSLLPRRASIIAALMWIAMPHVFWHMHLACFDVGVAGAHCALVLAYWRWRHTIKGALAVGVVFGLCAAVKHNVIPVPALLVVHWLLVERATAGSFASRNANAGAGGEAPPSRPRASRKIPLVFVSMAVVGPLVYLLHWPWLWPHPIERLGDYLAYHLHHENYPILYFGDLLTHPPFPVSFPFVMSAVTIPVPIAVAMLAGFTLAVVVAVRFFVARARHIEAEVTRVPLGLPSASAAILLAMNAAYPFLLIALPSTPKFGGTKHWMNALPFLCVLAAWALEEAFARLQLKPRTAIAIAALAILPGFVISARVWPYGLGSYNELIGFVRGAANVGMQRTFWGYEAYEALPVVDEKTPRGGKIHFGDTNYDDWKMYQRDHLLRSDIGFSNSVRGAAVASVQPQGEFKDQWMDVWNEWDDRTPDLVLGPEGVPVLTVTFHEASK